MKSGKRRVLASAIGAAAILAAPLGQAMANDNVYAGFPVTVKGYEGDKKTSVAYTGQIARHVLHDSLKKLASTGSGDASDELKAKLTAYFEGKGPGREIIAPKSKGPFVIMQSTVDEISKDKNLAGKTYKGTITGMPNNMTGPELVAFWIDKASAADGGVDETNGYDYSQLISKFIMGATFYNQAVDHYLDENLAADVKPNDQPYGEGDAYTGKEHSWDEGFGYFGTPAHTLVLTPKQVYDIAKLGASADNPDETFAAADHNKDGKIDLVSEMTFGPAYYAAGFDASVHDQDNGTTYLHDITRAFLDGRKLIASAKGEKLTDEQRAELEGYAETVDENWQKVLAEATYKYAGSVYKDMTKLQTIIEAEGKTDDVFADYIKHWGELKGFSLALQTGKENLGETATRLNRLIGFGPVLLDASQVTTVDSDGNYLRDQGPAWGEYMLHMAKVQKLMVDTFGVEAKNNAISGDIATLTDQLGSGAGAETD